MTTTDRSELENHARRNFMKLTAAGSFTAALVAGAAGCGRTRPPRKAPMRSANVKLPPSRP